MAVPTAGDGNVTGVKPKLMADTDVVLECARHRQAHSAPSGPHTTIHDPSAVKFTAPVINSCDPCDALGTTVLPVKQVRPLTSS